MKSWIFWFGTFSVLTTVASYAPVLKCMSCHKAQSFMSCKDVELCNPNLEVCYVEEEIDVGGETVVNAGCRLREHCDGLGCYGEEIYRRKRDLHHHHPVPDFVNRDISCHHCCDGDFCNMYGCPDKYDVSQLHGSRCFVCDAVEDPELCNTVENCEAQESCYIEHIWEGGKKMYKLGCIKSRMCELLAMVHNQSDRRKRFVPVWSDCCEPHMCNHKLPLETESPSMFSASYQCPILGVNNTWHTTTTAGIAVPTIGGEECENLVDCELYDYDYICIGKFKPWAEVNCPRYCGFCPDDGIYAAALYDTPTNDARVTCSWLLLSTIMSIIITLMFLF